MNNKELAQQLVTLATTLVAEDHYTKDYPELNRLALNITRALKTIRDDGAKLADELDKVPPKEVYSHVTSPKLRALVAMASKARSALFGWGGMSFTDPNKKP